jgi:VanZ like family/Concanavalin A-like lectin/glucanases superfamily
MPDNRFALLRVACFAMWAGLLVGGLLPFHFFPKNQVQWLPDKNGVHFGWYGEIYSAAPWNQGRIAGKDPGTQFSIEIWLEPDQIFGWTSSILSFYDFEQRKRLELQQSISNLVVRGSFSDQQHHRELRNVWLDDIRDGSPRFMTITSGPQGTVLYLEGACQKSYALTPAQDNLSGTLILGCPAAKVKPFAGKIFGLALYGRALTDTEVLQHYKEWIDGRTSELKTGPDITALYLFDERAGDLIRNHAGTMPQLIRPRRFSILHKTFLKLDLHKIDWLDIVLNIAGFIPFGWLLSAYFQSGAGFSGSKAFLLAVVLGGVTSLFIETSQAYLPSRDSSLLDLINNVLGTSVGAIIRRVFPYSGIAGRDEYSSQ